MRFFLQYLADKDAGESIIRPSSKGPSFLTLTIKICDGVYSHKDIVESGKDHKDITSSLRLGKTLKIDDETFEDLDEVSCKTNLFVQGFSYLLLLLEYAMHGCWTKSICYLFEFALISSHIPRQFLTVLLDLVPISCS